MSSSSLFAAAFAIFGISSRMLVFAMGWDNSVATQLYFLFLLLAVFFGIRAFFISNQKAHLFNYLNREHKPVPCFRL